MAEVPTLDGNKQNLRPEEEAKATLAALTDDYNRLRRQKSRKVGGIEGQALLNLAFTLGEHYLTHANGAISPESREEGKLYLVFNLVGPRVDKLVGRITSIAPVFQAAPDKKDVAALHEVETVNSLIRALDDKLDQPSKTWQIVWTMAVMGTAFEYITYIPNAAYELMPVEDEMGEFLFNYTSPEGTSPIKESQMQLLLESGVPQESFELIEEVQTVGEVGSEVLSPLQVFIDQSVKSIDDLGPDQMVYVAKIKTVGWVKENYPEVADQIEAQKDFQIVSTNLSPIEANPAAGVWLKDLIPTIQGSNDDSDPPMVLFVEGYSPRSTEHPKGRKVCFIPGQLIIKDEENPYEEIPLVDYHFKPVTTNFWTQAYVTGLIAPQRFVNKRLSQLGEQANTTLYSNLLLGPNLTKDQIPADRAVPIEGGLDENGTPMVGRQPPPILPPWFMQSIQLVTTIFNDVAGSQGLFSEGGQGTGQMRGPLAVPMMQEILDTEWGPLFNHLGERMARSKQMRLNRVKKFYPPVRTMHYTSADQRQEVLEFHSEEILGGQVNYNITVERAGLLPELRALRENRIMTRLSGPLAVLYMDDRTGAIDKSKVAADMMWGDAGRESREATYRKLGAEITEMLKKGEMPAPPLPFWEQLVVMDEMEAWMATMEFHMHTSPPIQQNFINYYNILQQQATEKAMAQQQSMMTAQTHSAVAQATQQAAAMAAAQAVDEATTQMRAQSNQPTEEFVSQAQAANQPEPKVKKRSTTTKKEETLE